MAQATTRRIGRVMRPESSSALSRSAERRPPTRKRPHLGGEWKEEFLEELQANGGFVQHACDAVGIVRSTFYRARQQDEAFAVAVADARDYGTESLEREVYRRAFAGSDLLAMFTLKARLPHIYRDNYRLPVSLDEDQLTAITRAMQDALGQVELSPQQERDFLARLESGLKGMEEAA